MSGDMLVPDLPTPGGTPYVWPGLQSNNGVLQAVLDGRSGTWWIGDGFYGTPSLSWGNGFNVYPGDTVHFEFSVVSCTPLRIVRYVNIACIEWDRMDVYPLIWLQLRVDGT